MTNIVIKTEEDLKIHLYKNYKNQINNYFGDEKKALKFLSAMMSAVQRQPDLLDCRTDTVINSFMRMAEFGFMPSDVSGEAYIIPYRNRGVLEAQFQIGYQGFVTLFYRAGAKSITAEIVRKKDKFSYVNGVINHEPDIFADDRGEAIGAYVIIETAQGGRVNKVMKKSDIIGIGQKFSKSFNTPFTPWKEANDPELWMWKKTVLKQAAKLVPKSDTIFKAIAADNEDSIIQDRIERAKPDTDSLKMGNLIKQPDEEPKKSPEDNQKPQGESKN